VIRWTEHASVDVVGIARWIAAEDSAAAERVADAIFAAVTRLEEFPLSGRAGRVPDTRELVVHGLPYLIVYRVETPSVAILRVLHGAMQWPETPEDGSLPSRTAG
jgi:toxin ParE1/3/4